MALLPATAFRGLLTVYGVDAATYAGTLDAAGASFTFPVAAKVLGRSTNITPTIVELKNGAGQIEGLGNVEDLVELDLKIQLRGTDMSGTASTSVLDALTFLLNMTGLSVITITAATGSVTYFDGKAFALMGTSLEESNESPAQITLKLKRFPNCTLTTALTT